MSTTTVTVTAAAVQAAPVFLDRDATVDKAVRLIAEAASDGARLIAFPEAYVPTYPDWVWRTSPWADGPARWYERLLDQAVGIPGPVTERLGKASRAAGASVSIDVGVVLARIVLGFYGFWLVWQVLLPWLPGPDDPDDRIAPYARYFTDPILLPASRATRIPVRWLALTALVAIAAAHTALPG